MSLIRRLVLVLYFSVLCYLSVRVPWSERLLPEQPSIRLGYSWIWHAPDQYAVIDLSSVVLQITAATALFAAVFLLAARWRRE